jgi:undecaprenyl-diphosphatase
MMKMSVRFINGDTRIFGYVNRSIQCRALDIVLPKVTHLGGAFFATGLLLFLTIFKRFGWGGLAALAGSHLVVQLLKLCVGRTRPYLVIPGARLSAHPLRDRSFPSGHTTAAFTLATSLSLAYPPLAYICFPLALLVGLSRIYLGLHYPSDVLIGAVLGTLAVLLAHFLRLTFA